MPCTAHPSIVFMDASLPDLATLQAALPAGVEIHLLDPKQDGLRQMAALLVTRQEIPALHLITHGAPGRLFLGNASIGRADLRDYRNEISTLASALIEDGELLIYGCAVAAGREGRQFIGALTEMTGLKVVGVAHREGNPDLGRLFGTVIMPLYPAGLPSISIRDREH